MTRSQQHLALVAGLLLLGALLLAPIVVPPAVPGSEGRSAASGAPLTAPPSTHYPFGPGALFVATTGSDSAAGTRKDPLRTLSAAVERADQGTTIVLREGTYRGTVGLVRKRLTIQPFPGEQVWFKGSVVVRDWTRTAEGWRHDGWNPGLCRDCFLPEIIDPDHPLAGLPDMVFVDGRPLRQVADADSVTRGTFSVDPERNTLLIGTNPAGRTVEASAFPWLLQFDGPRAAGSTIRGVGVAHYASYQEYGQRGAMVVVNAPSVTLENNTFAYSASSGAAVFQPGATVAHNTFADNGLVGLVANRADDLELSGNTFTRNNREHFALSGKAIGAAGAKITRTKRPVIRSNAFVDNIGTGWWCDLGCTDAVVVNNVARGNAVHGLYYEVSSTALIASNLVLDNGGKGLKISSSENVSVYHNTFVGNGWAIGIYNDPRSPRSDPYSHRLGLSWITSHTELVNNYFAGTRGDNPFVISADHKPEPVATPPFVSHADGNAYLRTDERPLAVWFLGSGGTVGFDSLDELTSRTGQGAHSIEVPRRSSPFRDPSAGDYLLRTDAPGVDAGRPLPAHVARAVGVPAAKHPDMGLLRAPGPE